MKSIITIDRDVKEGVHFCDICTAKATVHFVLGRCYVHNLETFQFWTCDECAEKIGKKLESVL